MPARAGDIASMDVVVPAKNTGVAPGPMLTFAGVLTAVGGGILRDVFVNQVPIVFVKELYVSASIVGVVVFYLILLFDGDLYVASICGIVVATGLRMVAMKYNWNLPRVKGI